MGWGGGSGCVDDMSVAVVYSYVLYNVLYG